MRVRVNSTSRWRWQLAFPYSANLRNPYTIHFYWKFHAAYVTFKSVPSFTCFLNLSVSRDLFSTPFNCLVWCLSLLEIFIVPFFDSITLDCMEPPLSLLLLHVVMYVSWNLPIIFGLKLTHWFYRFLDVKKTRRF